MKFIAEIGMNHNGNFDFAFELIKQAKISGADIAKFQLGWRDGKDDINYFSDSTIKLIKKKAGLEDNYKKLGININTSYNKIISGVNLLRLKNLILN